MTFHKMLLSGVAVLAAGSLASTANAALIANGSFEDATLAPWTVGAGLSASRIGAFNAPDGSFAAALSFDAFFGTASGRFSQTFNVAAPGRYALSYRLGRAEFACGCDDVPLTFGAFIDTTLLSNQISPGVASFATGAPFTEYSLEIDLTAGSHLLAFDFSRGPTLFGRGPVFVLDGVGVAQVANAVPEPASWAMMIAGFGMAGAAARGRRRLPIAA